MTIRQRFASWLFDRLFARVAAQRAPDLVIGVDNPDGAYLYRWYVVPRNKLFNVYLHEFLRDDDDRALHDHPWFWCSFLLHGSYIEHTIRAGGIHQRVQRAAASIRIRSPWHAHRVELLKHPIGGVDKYGFALTAPTPCWTLFITGPRMRRWGFHCPTYGWVDFAVFTQSYSGRPGEIGQGCDG